jgi:hypothetical protein
VGSYGPLRVPRISLRRSPEFLKRVFCSAAPQHPTYTPRGVLPRAGVCLFSDRLKPVHVSAPTKTCWLR